MAAREILPKYATHWGEIDAQMRATSGRYPPVSPEPFVVGSASVQPPETSPPASVEDDPSLGTTPDPWQMVGPASEADALGDQPHPLELQSAPQRAAHKVYHRERWHIVNSLWQDGVHVDLRKRAVRMGRCCQMPSFRLAADGTIKPALTRCRDRLCPLCAEKRGRVAARRTEALVAKMNSPRFFTLTLKHRGEHLGQMAVRGGEALAELRSTSTWKKHCKGGVWAAETTLNVANGEWHWHIHLICDGTYFPQPVLKALWEKITGDSYIVHIKPIHDRRAAARYIARYVAKPVDAETWPSAKVREYAEAMHGRRLLQTFGAMHNLRLDEDDQPEPPNPTTHLLHTSQLVKACTMGLGCAQRARHLLARMGREHAMAAGVDPVTVRDLPLPTPTEHRYALDVLAALFKLPEHEWAAFNLPPSDHEGDDPPPSFPLDRDTDPLFAVPSPDAPTG